jgi:hypothetical protein
MVINQKAPAARAVLPGDVSAMGSVVNALLMSVVR